MNQIIHQHPRLTSLYREGDPFHIGWRYVHLIQPDGTIDTDLVPLTEEDLVYPEEDDFVVQQHPHLLDLSYLHAALTYFFRQDSTVAVLGDCRVDWGPIGVRPLGPDILVLFEVLQWNRRGTFRIAEEGGIPILVIEVMSPSTRNVDLNRKPVLYYRAGVQVFVQIDRGPSGYAPARLIGYRRGPTSWVELPPDEQGRLDLAPIGLNIVLEGERPWLYETATGTLIPDLTGAMAERAEEQARAIEAENRAKDAEAKAKDAEAKADEAEGKAKDAEARARDEAEKRAALEERLRLLEAQLQKPNRPEGPNGRASDPS